MKYVFVVCLMLTICLVTGNQVDTFFATDCSSSIANKVITGGYLRELERLKYSTNPLVSSKLLNVNMNDVTDIESDDLLAQINELRLLANMSPLILLEDSFNYTIFDNFPLSKQFVCNASYNFAWELLGDNRSTIVAEYLGLLSTLQTGSVTLSQKDVFLLEVLKLLADQTETNPPQYVSHGTDHSVRVMGWAFTLLNLDDVQQGMTNVYGSTGNQSKFLLGSVGLFHDIGYADLDQHKVPKWLHSTASGILARLMLTNRTNSIGAQILQGLTTKGNIVEDMVYAIATHNFDDGFCKWNVNNSLYQKQCTFAPSGDPNNPTSATTPLLNGTALYTRGYTLGYASTAPLTFAVRVADNLDAVRSRLTPVQNSPQLMQYLLWLYTSAEIRTALVQNANKEITDAQLNDVYAQARIKAAQVSGLTNVSTSMQQIMQASNEQSFLHFYSNWIVKGITLDMDEWEVVVEFWDSDTLDFASHPGPGLYQINRFASSAFSCYVRNDASFLDLLRVTVLDTIQGIDVPKFLPQKSFTKKPVYNETGRMVYPSGNLESICDPYCPGLTPPLTFSPEECHNMDGSDAEFCDNNGFSQIAPYTDLTYPTDPPMPNVAAASGTEKVMWIVLVLLLQLILV